MAGKSVWSCGKPRLLKIATGGMHSVEDVLERMVDVITETRLARRSNVCVYDLLSLVDHLEEGPFLAATSKIAAWALDSEFFFSYSQVYICILYPFPSPLY